MCIRITLPPTAEHIAEAQWDLIDILAQAFASTERHSNARQSLSRALEVARLQTNSPQQWASAFAQRMVETVSTLQTAANTASDAAAKATQLELDRDYLRSIVRAQNIEQDQVEALIKERASLLRRSTGLAAALRLVRDEYRRDVSDLQSMIVDLNRIVADQQEQLDVLGR